MYDQSQIATPVAFLIFNRPDTTQRVFEAIARARPRKLLVVADGPRADRPEDAAKCSAARAIVERVDWPCEVLKNYSEVNLGCRKRVSSGIDWVFSEVEEAIILEDDCLPSQSFFPFCETLLSKYRDDKHVMHISGDNFQKGIRRSGYSYYFSRIPHIWGWATWRRAWRHYDVDLAVWPALKSIRFLGGLFPDSAHRLFWEKWVDEVYNGAVDTWDAQWNVACWIHSGLAIVPEVNLVSNIGARDDATHTKGTTWYFDMPVEELAEFLYPPFCEPDRLADAYTMKAVFCCESDEEERACAAPMNRFLAAGKLLLFPFKRLLRRVWPLKS